MIYLENSVEKIKKSAARVFIQKGYYGSRLNEIALDAEVSKSLLHYYFRTKENLFEIIIDDSINLIINNLNPALENNLNFWRLIEQFTYSLYRLFRNNTSLLLFIITEYNQNFDRIKFSLNPIYVFFTELELRVQYLAQKEGVKIKNSKHLMINIISIFAGHIIESYIFFISSNGDKNANSRTSTIKKQEIHDTVINYLKTRR